MLAFLRCGVEAAERARHAGKAGRRCGERLVLAEKSGQNRRPALPLNVLCPEVYSGNGGVTKNGAQSSSATVMVVVVRVAGLDGRDRAARKLYAYLAFYDARRRVGHCDIEQGEQPGVFQPDSAAASTRRTAGRSGSSAWRRERAGRHRPQKRAICVCSAVRTVLSEGKPSVRICSQASAHS